MNDSLARKVAAVVGRDVHAAGLFVPEGTQSRRTLRSLAPGGGVLGAVAGVAGASSSPAAPPGLPSKVVLALGDDTLWALRKPLLGAPTVAAAWPLSDVSATVFPKRLTYALHVRLRQGGELRLEMGAGRGDAMEHPAYRIARASQVSFD